LYVIIRAIAFKPDDAFFPGQGWVCVELALGKILFLRVWAWVGVLGKGWRGGGMGLWGWGLLGMIFVGGGLF